MAGKESKQFWTNYIFISVNPSQSLFYPLVDLMERLTFGSKLLAYFSETTPSGLRKKGTRIGPSIPTNFVCIYFYSDPGCTLFYSRIRARITFPQKWGNMSLILSYLGKEAIPKQIRLDFVLCTWISVQLWSPHRLPLTVVSPLNYNSSRMAVVALLPYLEKREERFYY